jgi:hypothetical protein
MCGTDRKWKHDLQCSFTFWILQPVYKVNPSNICKLRAWFVGIPGRVLRIWVVFCVFIINLVTEILLKSCLLNLWLAGNLLPTEMSEMRKHLLYLSLAKPR